MGTALADTPLELPVWWYYGGVRNGEAVLAWLGLRR